VRNLSFSHNKVKKLLSYATFYAGATWKALTAPRPDVVLTLTAPPGLAWIGWLMQRVRGCRHVAGLSSAPGRRRYCPGRLHERSLAAASDPAGADLRRGELGGWAKYLSTAPS
jgi:hypothetical protein